MSTLLTTPASVAWTQATLLSWSTASRSKGRLARLLARRRTMRVAPAYRRCADRLGPIDPDALVCANDNAPC